MERATAKQRFNCTVCVYAGADPSAARCGSRDADCRRGFEIWGNKLDSLAASKRDKEGR